MASTIVIPGCGVKSGPIATPGSSALTAAYSGAFEGWQRTTSVVRVAGRRMTARAPTAAVPMTKLGSALQGRRQGCAAYTHGGHGAATLQTLSGIPSESQTNRRAMDQRP